MTANKMPLMLENTLPVDLNDVDDLFGDGVSLPIPGRAQGKHLQQRIDEMRSRGCCQAVAWSRAGTVAVITPDGQNVEFRCLARSPKDGSWDLSESTTCQLVKGTPTIPIVHLSWAGTSSPELAIIDAVGRVTLVSFSISLNSPFVARKWDGDSLDDMHTVVGCYWLNLAPVSQQPYYVMHGPANKHGQGYSYESSFVHVSGPLHPNTQKSALLTVTGNGMLKLFWTQNTNRQEETTLELESVSSSDDLVTRAAFAAEKRHLMLAVATSARQLRLVRIDIQWHGPGVQADKNNTAQNNNNKVLNPSMSEKHLATASWLQGDINDISQDLASTDLSLLEVIPSVMDNTGKNIAPAVVLAVRSRVPSEGSYQMAQSIIDRWELVEHKQNLHPAFKQLGARRNSMSSDLPGSMSLRKLDPVIINKIVIGFHSIYYGKVLVFAFADGTVEHRDRFTFEEVYTTEDTSKLLNLRQAGWSFADEGPCQQVTFSPTNCSMIQMGGDGKVRWNKLQYPTGDIGNTMQEARYAASIAGLAIAAASSMFSQNNFDDILAIVRPYVEKRKFVQDWISDVIRILKIHIDYSEDTHHDSLVRNALLQSCLSILNSVGFRGEFAPRSFQSKFSMLALNVRNVVVLVTIASNTPITVREKLSPLDEPEVVEALAGCARWSLDLLSWLVDSLYELMNDNKFLELLVPQRFSELSAYLQGRNNVSLNILLSSSSRGFLSAVCRRLGHLEAISTRAIDFYRRQSAQLDAASGGMAPNPDLQAAYKRMQRITTSSSVKVGEFEKLLSVLGEDIRQSYQSFIGNYIKAQQKPPQGKQLDVTIKTAQIQFELALLLSSGPPPPFAQVIGKFFRDLRAFEAHVNREKLFFADYTLLEVEDNKNSLAGRKNNEAYVDVFKRTKLKTRSSALWRRCTRCAAVMEDVYGSRPGYAFVLGQQRKCACGGHWILLPPGKR